MTRPRSALGAVTTTLVVVTLAFASFPAAVEAWYCQGLGLVLTGALISVTSRVPFSLAEWIEAAAITGLLVYLARVAVRCWLDPKTWKRTLFLASGELYVAGTFVFWLFYVLWGLSYARPPAEVRLGWDASADHEPLEPDVEELAELTELLVWHVNDLYAELHGFSDAYTPTDLDDLDAVDQAIEQGYATLAQRLDLHPSLGRSRGRTKQLLSSEVFAWLGIGGFYFPFTGEANINRHAPRWQQPHTIAHEKAHQRLVASENEANFYGFLACVHSDHPVARYSGWLFAQRQALRALLAADPERGHELLLQRYPGVQRDVTYAYAVWSRYDGPLEELGTAVNHAYLTVNRVEGGIDSYGRSLELIVRYAREDGLDSLADQ